MKLHSVEKIGGTSMNNYAAVRDNIISLCQHGHFALESHLAEVREMLASVGEAHSAWNMTELLKQNGFHAWYVDLTGWGSKNQTSLDQRIEAAFKEIDLSKQLSIVALAKVFRRHG